MKPLPGKGEVTRHSKRRRHVRAPSDAATARQNESSGENYRVGPGHPPREYQFKPGQSGNRGGRKKQVRDLRALFQRALNKNVKLRRGERADVMTRLEAGFNALASQFAEGDHRARRDVFAFAAKPGIALTAGRGDDRDINVSSQEELRQALLDRGIPARLLPPIDEAGLEPPQDPPLPTDVEEEENKK